MPGSSTTLRGFIITAAALLIIAAAGKSALSQTKTVDAGASWVVPEPTTLSSLTVADGAEIKALDGYSLTLTVDGVERDIKPGTYKGKIVLTPTEENLVRFGAFANSNPTIHHFRQAIYLDSSGIEKSKSVVAAAGDYAQKGSEIDNLNIRSEGENFNGVYAAEGTFTLKGTKINFAGPGGDDFAGWGAGIMSTGKNTTLIVDHADVSTRGVVRTTMIADKGSSLIVKNSHVEAKEGVQPPDYQSNTTPGKMRDVPWMLGLAGNCRATNLLGDHTIATYINSTIAAEGWGVLSIDSGSNAKLTVINSKVEITGQSGYGTYSIGNALNSFYGSTVTVPDYGAIVTGGNVVFGASTPETVARLNNDLKLNLTSAELAATKPAQSTVNSKRFGVMIWGQGGAQVNTVKILDGTIFNTDEAIFVDRGASATIDVNGSKGAQLNSKNGIILQLMDLDKAPGVQSNGMNLTTGVYKDPTLPVAKVAGFDLTATHNADVVATFSNISLRGDFYNGITTSSAGGGMPGGPPGAGGPAGGMPGGGGGSGGGVPDGGMPAGGGAPGVGIPGGGMPGGAGGQSAAPTGKNLILKFENSTVAGVITASTARHAKDTLTSADYKLVSEVKNTPGAVVNNGVVIALDHSTWTVTGACYLTSLSIGEGSKVIAPQGKTAILTVDGAPKPIGTGDYKGAIVLNVR